jgi:hypothetical protein
VEALLPDGAGANETAPAQELAKAQLELLRIRSIRTEMLAGIDPASDEALWRLLAVDRCETQAFRNAVAHFGNSEPDMERCNLTKRTQFDAASGAKAETALSGSVDAHGGQETQ